MSFKLILLGLVTLIGWGQTKIPAAQVLVGEGFIIQLPNLILVEGTQFKKIKLDPAVFALISVDGGTQLTIKIPPAQQTSTLLLSRSPDGTYTSPSAPLKVFRNGLIQILGEDFTLNGLVLTMLNDPQPTDKIIVEIK